MTRQFHWPSDEVILQVAQPLAAFLLTLVVLLVVRHLVIRWLHRHSREEGSFVSAILETLRVPSMLWCIAGAVQLGLEISIIPHRYIFIASQAIVAFLIISLSMVLASATVRALTVHGRRRGVPFALSGLARTLIRVLIFTCAATAVLALYHVNIVPLLGVLGVSGLAVALALQDTLANFFAGIHILIEEPIALGSAIRLSSGEDGVVTDIGWRTTRVRNGANNVVVIPNTKITSGILVNYNLPELRQTADVAILVGFDADVDHVRRIAIEEARSCDGVLPSPEPVVFFSPGVTPTHLQLTLVFSVPELGREGPVKSDVRLRIHRRFRSEGVPFPSVASDKILARD